MPPNVMADRRWSAGLFALMTNQKPDAKKPEDRLPKMVAEMNLTGEPEIKVDYPERWIEEFPPQAVIGYYELDPLPAAPTKMHLVVTITSHSLTGADINGTEYQHNSAKRNWNHYDERRFVSRAGSGRLYQRRPIKPPEKERVI